MNKFKKKEINYDNNLNSDICRISCMKKVWDW